MIKRLMDFDSSLIH